MKTYVVRPPRAPRALFIVGPADLPRALGFILIVTGLGLMSYFGPSIRDRLSPVIEPVGVMAKLLLMF